MRFFFNRKILFLLIEQEVNQSKKRKKDGIIYNIFDIDSPYSLMSVTLNTEIKGSSIFFIFKLTFEKHGIYFRANSIEKAIRQNQYFYLLLHSRLHKVV